MSYMPPAAIPSSVAVTMASEPSSPRRSKNSSVEAAGNLAPVRTHRRPARTCLRSRARPRTAATKSEAPPTAASVPRSRCVGDATRLALDVVTPLPPRLRDGTEHIFEARHAVTWLRRKVRAGIERLPFRCHEHRRRPATRADHPDRRLHRHRIHVGSLLAVDLHVDEEVVHDGSRCGVLEGLVRHDVAPVARAVADRDERQCPPPCPLERLVAPRVPVDRVLGVLEQIWARSAPKTVHSEEGTRAAKADAATSGDAAPSRPQMPDSLHEQTERECNAERYGDSQSRWFSKVLPPK